MGVVVWIVFAAYCCSCWCSLLLFVVGDAVAGVGGGLLLLILLGVD